MVLKSTTKTKLLLSTLMALTIGVGVVNQHESVVKAEEKTSIYEVQTTSKVTLKSGDDLGDVSYSQTYNTAKQLTSGNYATLKIKAPGLTLTSLTLSMKSNASKGAGSLTIKNGLEETTATSTTLISTSNFNSANWHGSYSSAYVPIDVTDKLSSLPNKAAMDYMEITITASANSLYIESYTIGWEKVISKNKVTFNTNANGDQSLTFDSPTEIEVETGTIVDAPEHEPNRDGYVFKGWFTTEDAANSLDESKLFKFGEAQVNDDITLYAGWSESTTYYTVTFDANGGSGVTEKSVLEGNFLNAEDATTTRDNYEFVGWFTEEDVKWDFEGHAVTQDMKLKAKWDHEDALLFSLEDSVTKMNVSYRENKDVEEESLLVKYDLSNVTATTKKIEETKTILDYFTVAKGNIVESVAGLDNIFGGDSTQGPLLTGLKLGSDGKGGSFTLNLKESVSKIVIFAKYWPKKTEPTIKINDNTITATITNSTDGEPSKISYNFEPSTTSVKIESVSERLVISSIEFYGKSNLSITSVELGFGTTFDSSIYHDTASYGLIALKTDEETKEFKFDSSTFDTNNNCEITRDEVEALLENKTAQDYKFTNLHKTDENGNEDEAGGYYTFGVKFSDMLQYIDDEIIAVAYMEFEGKIYFNNQTQYSLRSLAKKYKELGTFNDNETAQSILDRLINYINEEAL